MDKNLLLRSLSGLVYVVLIFICTTSYGSLWFQKIGLQLTQTYIFYGLISFFTLMGVLEAYRIMNFAKSWERFFVFPLCFFVYYLFSKRYFMHQFYYEFGMSDLLALSLILILIITLFRFKEELYIDSGKLIFIAIYVALSFGFSLGLPDISADKSFGLEVFFLFVLMWCSDSFAYLFGKLFGKHKMAPNISPKKTWEGFVGGCALTILAGYFIEHFRPNLRGNWMFVGALVSVFAPLGDLVESQFKRVFDVKDSGSIMPGHGGILDRLDSFIICAPVVYLYFVLDRMF